MCICLGTSECFWCDYIQSLLRFVVQGVTVTAQEILVKRMMKSLLFSQLDKTIRMTGLGNIMNRSRSMYHIPLFDDLRFVMRLMQFFVDSIFSPETQSWMNFNY